MSNRCKHLEYWPKERTVHNKHIKKKWYWKHEWDRISAKQGKGTAEPGKGKPGKALFWNIREQHKHSKVSLQSRLFCDYKI